jgi:hypothetical protein
VYNTLAVIIAAGKTATTVENTLIPEFKSKALVMASTEPPITP